MDDMTSNDLPRSGRRFRAHPALLGSAAVAALAVLALLAVAIRTLSDGSAGGEAPPAAATRPDAGGEQVIALTALVDLTDLTAPIGPAAAAPGTAPARADPTALAFAPHEGTAAASALAPARAAYASAIAAFDGGAYALAAQRFAAAAESGGPLREMARLRQAQMLVADDQREQAAPLFAAVIAGDALPTALRSIALTEAASNLNALHRGGAAIPLLWLVDMAPGVDTGTRAGARWQIAQIRRDQQDPAWVDDARAALALSIRFSGATEALTALTEAGAAVPPLTAALVRYRAYHNEEAGRLLATALMDTAHPLSAADAGMAWFYLGALQERASDTDNALADYALSVALAPAGPLADDALYWRALIYADRGNISAEAAEFDRLARGYPNSAFAAEARLRAAVDLGRAGRVAEALTRLEAITNGPSSTEAAAAARWHEVFRSASPGSTAMALSAATYAPTSFGAILERTRLDAALPLPASALAERAGGSADAAAIPGWIEATFGPRVDAASIASTASTDADTRALGFELVAAGDTSVGRTLLFDTLDALADRPYDLLAFAGDAAAAGLYDLQIAAASTLLAPLTGPQRLQAPPALLRLAYPAPYAAETAAAVQENNLPALLLLALVRQESAFNARAGSSAGAYGLAQIMPGTAADVARQLGLPAPDTAALGDPALSLRLGARYLADQLAAFDGNPVAALAAYNGGPGNARRWLEAQAPRNADGYAWTVDFGETRRYLEQVLTNYAWYRYIYAGAPLAIR